MARASADRGGAGQPSLRSRAAPALGLALLAVAAYGNTTANEPVLDDGWVIFDNPSIRSLRSLPRIFREPYNVAGLDGTAGLYRPVTTATYALSYAAGGRSVLGYHLVNLALHLACTLLVLALFGPLARSVRDDEQAGRAAWLAAALFAVHPAHVEAVTMMAGRAELLAALFSLSCLYLVCTRARARWRLPLGLACLALGVLSKESAGITPLLFGLIGWLLPGAAGLQRERRWTPLLGLCAALCAAACAYPALKLLGPGGLGVPPGAQYFQGAPRAVVALTMTRALAAYLRILVWPHPLGLDFHYRVLVPLTYVFTGPAARATLAWTATLGAALLLRQRAPLVTLGVLWLFAALLPVSNLVPIGTHLAERLLYLPSAGFLFAVAAAAVELSRLLPAGRPALLRGALPAAALAALCVLTWQRSRDWRSLLTLWTAEHERAPDDPVVNLSLASAWAGRGEFARGRAFAERAVELAPSNWAAHANLGIAAHGLSDDEAADRELRLARELAPRLSAPLFFLGEQRLDQGRFEEAAQLFAEASLLAPEEARVVREQGVARHLLGERAEAHLLLTRALALDPADPLAGGYLAVLELSAGGVAGAGAPGAGQLSGFAFECGTRLLRAGRPLEALQQFGLALRLDPGHSRALFEMARCQQRLGDADGARESLQRALRISPGFDEAKAALGALVPAEDGSRR